MEDDDTLKEVLRKLPWSAILVPLAIGLLLVLLFLGARVIED